MRLAVLTLMPRLRFVIRLKVGTLIPLSLLSAVSETPGASKRSANGVALSEEALEVLLVCCRRLACCVMCPQRTTRACPLSSGQRLTV